MLTMHYQFPASRNPVRRAHVGVVGSGGVGRAQDCAEVVRILHAIKHQNQRVLSPLGSDHVVEIVRSAAAQRSPA